MNPNGCYECPEDYLLINNYNYMNILTGLTYCEYYTEEMEQGTFSENNSEVNVNYQFSYEEQDNVE